MRRVEISGAGAPDALADRLGRLARRIQHEQDLPATLDAIVHAAVLTVPGAEHASLSSVRGRRHVVTLAATSELSRAVDQAQYGTGEGPCLDALYQRQTVRLPDLSVETRWPRFLARARALGVGSMLAVQLYVDGDDLGALNLMSGRPHRFDDESEHVAVLFAVHAAVAMAAADQRQNLTVALGNRDVIGQAKGILMERYKVTAVQAFDLLARASMDTQRKLVDVAAELTDTGALPAQRVEA